MKISVVKFDLVAIDIDGTLVNSSLSITKPVFEAVQRVVDAGAKIVLCTGRPFPGAEDYMKELGLTREGDYIINYHGALVQKTDTGEIILDHQLTYDDMMKWHALAKEHDSNFQAVRNDGVYSEQTDFSPKALIEPFVNEMPLRVRTLAEMDAEISYSKFMMKNDEPVTQKLEDHVPVEYRKDYTVIRSEADSLEVLNQRASKGQSLKELANLLEIPKKRVMAIGDSGNDIDMVEFAGLGVAMGNAVTEVKKVADVITDTNDEDGVARAIEHYFFEE
jgi:hypothetical protein